MSPRHLFRTLLIVPALLCATAVFCQTTPKPNPQTTPQTTPETTSQPQTPPSAGPTTAYADIMNAQGLQIGTATITSAGRGVAIALKLTGLPPGVHGIHIHSVGKCEVPAFASAGGHLNPDMKMHGKDNPMGPHAGDLPNFTVDANGMSDSTVTDDHVTLADGPNSLFHQGGTALVIHAMPDDYKSDPAGNSGARIACGVIYTHVTPAATGAK
jgi:Cu-Zn family superoxide dismutase